MHGVCMACACACTCACACQAQHLPCAELTLTLTPTLTIMQSRDARKWSRSRRIQLLRIAEWSARNDERTSAEYSKAGIHTELLQELSGAVSTPGQFNDAKSVWVAQLVSTLDGLNLHSKHTRETTTKVCGCRGGG